MVEADHVTSLNQSEQQTKPGQFANSCNDGLGNVSDFVVAVQILQSLQIELTLEGVTLIVFGIGLFFMVLTNIDHQRRLPKM